MQLTPYLNFDGNCAEAFAFYAKLFNGSLFDALAQGGQTVMPFAATFWSPGFGMTKDRFGTPWMVNVPAAD